MEYLGSRAPSEARVYFASGTSIVYWGLREKSIDVDLKAEGDGLGRILRDAKRDLEINIEPEHPGNFIPLPKSWRERSPFIKTAGKVHFFHMDPYSVAISKLSRATQKDLNDVKELIRSGRIETSTLNEIYFDEQYQDKLTDQFSIEPTAIGEKIKEITEESGGKGEP